MNTEMKLFPATNPNPILSVGMEGTIIYSNIAGESLLQEWGVKVGEQLPSHIGDLVKRIIFQNTPEKIEVKAGSRIYLVSFHPMHEKECIECVNVYGFDISDQKKLEDEPLESKALEIADLDLADVIDIKAIQFLMDDFYELVHIPMSIVDLKGNVLVGVGWQDICTKFHRRNPKTYKCCIESSTTLSEGILHGEFKLYKCKNNIWHITTPIMVGEHHVGNIISGQFFFEDEPRDYELFRSKARKYGFDEEIYIATLKKVPRLSRKAVDTGMSFFIKLANMISQLSYSNIKLAQSLVERDTLLEALRGSEEKSRNLIEAANDGILILNDISMITYVNKKMAEMLECTQDEIIGKSVRDFTDEDGRAIFESNMKNRRQGIDESHEFKFIKKDSSVLWTLVNSKALFDNSGKFIGSLSMLADITERKKAEEVLRLSTKYNRSLIEASLDPLVTIGRDGKITDANSATEQVTGYSSSDLIGTDFSDYFTEPNKAREGYQQAFTYGKVRNYPLKIRHENGQTTPVLYNASVYKDENGEVIGIFAAARDIAELKKAEEKIQALANAVESSDDAIVTMYLDGIISSWNKGAEQVYGYFADDVLGKDISVLEPDNFKGEIRQLIEKIKQGERIQHYETLRLKKDNTTINVSVTLSPIFDQSRKLVSISCIAKDITEKKIAEKLLQEKQIAEVANRTKSEFLAKISHELRTPLNSIIGFSDMLYEQMYGELNQKQKKSVGNISKSGKHLLELLNDILDISKIEAGKMELCNTNFNLYSKLNMIRSILSPIADKKNIKIEIDVDSTLASIFADEEKFVQIMYNLLDNAIKFSYENSLVKIDARKKKNMVEIMVTDTGIGIEVEYQHKLFKPFSQVDSFTSRKYPGTGLGLYLVKQIVHMHKGYVWFRSNLGEGSTFGFVIPINYATFCA